MNASDDEWPTIHDQNVKYALTINGEPLPGVRVTDFKVRRFVRAAGTAKHQQQVIGSIEINAGEWKALLQRLLFGKPGSVFARQHQRAERRRRRPLTGRRRKRLEVLTARFFGVLPRDVRASRDGKITIRMPPVQMPGYVDQIKTNVSFAGVVRT